jgi:hypothetical protein
MLGSAWFCTDIGGAVHSGLVGSLVVAGGIVVVSGNAIAVVSGDDGVEVSGDVVVGVPSVVVVSHPVRMPDTSMQVINMETINSFKILLFISIYIIS